MNSRKTEESVGVPIDRMSPVDMIGNLIDAQERAVASVRRATPEIIQVVEAAYVRLERPGSRLVYCGAGTSGRIGLLDGVELAPTFGWSADRLAILMAGGDRSLGKAVEGAEDDREAGRDDIKGIGITSRDVVLGMAASGSTPYTLAALEEAGRRGALTVGVANNENAPLLAACDHAILLRTGSEVVAGSTRLAAGTSQKAFLNTFSTAVMVRLGRVYQGLMIDMEVTNEKLRGRAVSIVASLAGVDETSADRALDRAGLNIKKAILLASGTDDAEAAAALRRADGVFAKVEHVPVVNA